MAKPAMKQAARKKAIAKAKAKSTKKTDITYENVFLGDKKTESAPVEKTCDPPAVDSFNPLYITNIYNRFILKSTSYFLDG